MNSGVIFLKRELVMAAEEANLTDEGERMLGETFRQKEQERYYTLNPGSLWIEAGNRRTTKQ